MKKEIRYLQGEAQQICIRYILAIRKHSEGVNSESLQGTAKQRTRVSEARLLCLPRKTCLGLTTERRKAISPPKRQGPTFLGTRAVDT
ncbi:conserved hypothetical protein [Ricinus communis]|uniref:Uncharacterized protein n=1 Tax=Ricinus communis TaxID=3988 RepID=B9R9I8_RICCO|nr:conserved hypothetical protein [Ricinus communis]